MEIKVDNTDAIVLRINPIKVSSLDVGALRAHMMTPYKCEVTVYNTKVPERLEYAASSCAKKSTVFKRFCGNPGEILSLICEEMYEIRKSQFKALSKVTKKRSSSK